jgi:hypothetical protein
MDKGRILEEGPTATMFESPAAARSREILGLVKGESHARHRGKRTVS